MTSSCTPCRRSSPQARVGAAQVCLALPGGRGAPRGGESGEVRLQRLFADYVGVGPKWVIRRYRLHEITERMAAGGRIDWARLAAELGYADQAHLSRDFTAIVGESSTQYAQRYPDRAEGS